LNEIAAAINDDADVFTTLTTAIAAVQSDVDSNESAADSGRAALAVLITALTATVATNKTDSETADTTLTNAVAALDAKTVDGGDNVNNLVASTTPDSTPATFYFLAVDASTGAIKVVNKNFVEVE
jgi:hypothetical protein